MISSLKIFVSAFALVILATACQNSGSGGGSDTPVVTPTASAYELPSGAPVCLRHHHIHSQDEMCRSLRDGNGLNCASEERQEFFNGNCPNYRWQDRD